MNHADKGIQNMALSALMVGVAVFEPTASTFSRLPECHDAHLVDDVKLSGPVEVEDGLEGPRVSVEEVLVVHQRVRVAKLLYFQIK